MTLATVTPSPNNVPKANSSGKIDGAWLDWSGAISILGSFTAGGSIYGNNVVDSSSMLSGDVGTFYALVNAGVGGTRSRVFGMGNRAFMDFYLVPGGWGKVIFGSDYGGLRRDVLSINTSDQSITAGAGVTSFPCTTDATSTTSAGVTMACGLGVAQKIIAGDTITSGSLTIGFSSSYTSADGLPGFQCKNFSDGGYFTIGQWGSNGSGVGGWGYSTIFEAVPSAGHSGSLVFSAYRNGFLWQTQARTLTAMSLTSGGDLGVAGSVTAGTTIAAPSLYCGQGGLGYDDLTTKKYITNGALSDQFALLTVLPASGGGTYDAVTINAVMGPWDAASTSELIVSFGNRNSFAARVSRAYLPFATCSIRAYQNGGALYVYLVMWGNGVNGSNGYNKATVRVDQQLNVSNTPAFSSLTTTVPSGTLVWESNDIVSTPTAGSTWKNESGVQNFLCSQDATGAGTGTIRTAGGIYSAKQIWSAAPVRVGTYTVATLPTAGTAGRIAFATNGRKNGEGAGSGTGVQVYDDGTAWRRVSDDTTVAA